jgi:hypothetical protein
MDSELIAAYIAAGASLVGALITVVLTISSERKRRRHESRIEALKSELEKEVKRVEAQLTDQNSERSARRDYEYEARKRLYTEVEPVLFQLVELSEGALHRIYSLARTARHGNLSDPKRSWLNSDEAYYYRSTLYALLAPLAAVKLLQRRITFVDLSVEKSIAAEYALAKRLLITFTDDFDLARCRPELKYDPHADILGTAEGKLLLRDSPEVYWKQGVVLGDVEAAAESLLTEAADSRTARIKSYAEFDAEMDASDSKLSNAMREIRYLFLRFHPEQRPILWRLLVAQACLYNTFVELREAKLAGRPPADRPLRLIPAAERVRLNWRRDPAEANDAEAVEIPLQVAAQYLQKHAPGLFDPEMR